MSKPSSATPSNRPVERPGWDDRVFYARYHAGLASALDATLTAERELASAAAFLREIVKVALPFESSLKDAYGQPGGTRFGGMPDLPPGTPYPRYPAIGADGPREYAYEFVAQVDLAGLVALQDFLPRDGRLYFFLSTVHDLRGDVVLDYPVCRVLYDAAPARALVSGRGLRLGVGDYFDMAGGSYAAEAFGSPEAAVLSAPSFYSIHQNEELFVPVLRRLGMDAAAFFEDADDLFEHIDDTFDAQLDEGAHYVGGYGQSLHEFPITQAARARGGAPADYQLLLTVRSRGTMTWGEHAGDLYFVIHKGDLAQRDFSRVWVGMFGGA